MPELTEIWSDPNAERDVLIDLVMPAAQAQYDEASNRWNSLDAKAFGLIAVAAAVIAGLAATHEELHDSWWGPATGCVAAGVFLVFAIWPREFYVGAEIVDFHDEMRSESPLEAARVMVESITDATESLEQGYAQKASNFQIGLALLSVAVAGCVPVVLFHP